MLATLYVVVTVVDYIGGGTVDKAAVVLRDCCLISFFVVPLLLPFLPLLCYIYCCFIVTVRVGAGEGADFFCRCFIF